IPHYGPNSQSHYEIPSLPFKQFALDICNHFISSYCHVVYVKAYVQEVPWRRLEKNGIPHVHSFICVPEGIRFCEAEQCQNGCPLVISGIKELKLKKTTQSGFEGFHRDKYTTIPDRTDRVLSAELFCKWSYGECQDIDFDCVWDTVHESVLEAFSGPPDCGEYSPSHQKTVNNIQMLTLARIPQGDKGGSCAAFVFLPLSCSEWCPGVAEELA
uniref:Uricase n=1 Tax=Terrapene triunguis TaxID=2587831 RepID=A0A674IVE6_9SAUR